MNALLPWAEAADGLVVAIRLTPRGGRDTIEGIETLADGRPVLKARVRAAPSEGEANTALTRLLAKALRIPAGRITLVGGASARVKTLRIEGDARALAAALDQIAGRAGKAG